MPYCLLNCRRPSRFTHSKQSIWEKVKFQYSQARISDFSGLWCVSQTFRPANFNFCIPTLSRVYTNWCQTHVTEMVHFHEWQIIRAGRTTGRQTVRLESNAQRIMSTRTQVIQSKSRNNLMLTTLKALKNFSTLRGIPTQFPGYPNHT